MAQYPLSRIAIFAIPVVLILLCLGWTEATNLVPFSACVFYVFLMIIVRSHFSKQEFLVFSAISFACATMGLVVPLFQFTIEVAWIVMSLLTLVGVGFSAIYLSRQSGLVDRLNELETLTNTVPALLWTADGEQGGVDYINRPWQELGWSLEDLVGDKWGDMMHPDDLDRLRRQWQKSVETGTPYEEVMRVRRAWGDYRWMVIRATPQKNEAGTVRHWYGVASDIDDLKKAEERLEGMRNDLARVTRSNTMGELTASIAHDINQPLAAAVTNGQVALRWLASDTPNLSEAVEAMEDSVAGAKRAGDVIVRLRRLYQKSDPAPVLVDIGSVIADSVTLVSSLARSSDVTLQVDQSDAPCPVLGDAIQLQQVIINLVVNGIDAIKSSERESGTVIIRTSSNDDCVVIEVSDSGPGIAASDMDKMFDAFYSTKPTGLGMGLAICRTIVERLDGTITARNEPDGGAVFQVSLPVASGDTREPSPLTPARQA